MARTVELGARYGIPLTFVLAVAWSWLTGRRRSLLADAEYLVGRMNPRPVIEGEDNIPADGRFIIVANHYNRLGLWIVLCGCAISVAVARRRATRDDVRWVITSEWQNERLLGLPVPATLYRIAFGRTTGMFGMITMPVAPKDVRGRAAALLEIRSVLRPREGGRDGVVGIFPEHTEVPGLPLHEARKGTGLFFLYLSESGVPILPVGLAEIGGVLRVRFGPPFALQVPKGPKEERDNAARQKVMVAVGRLLPPGLWGFYSDAIQRADKLSTDSGTVGEVGVQGMAPHDQ